MRRYASGDREGALAEACAWPESRLKQEVPIRNRDWQRAEMFGGGMSSDAWRGLPARAGLMLHTDCALRARGGGWPSGLHEAAAWSIARMLEGDPAERAFSRRWYEAFAELAQGDFRWTHALDWAERGLKDFPDSAELMLVTGSVEEMRAVQAAWEQPPVDRHGERGGSESHAAERPDVRMHFAAARQALRAAVAADPALAEGHLRLGRVAFRLGDVAEARSALQSALAQGGGGRTAYLAHLFTGRLDEQAGHLAAAAVSYEAAVAIDPRCQSARLALSHARLRLGDRTRALHDVETSLGSAGQRSRDPLWLYTWGPAVGVEERLDALRREASNP